MPGAKLPILTITNKQYFRDDGLYIYSSADGTLDIVSDSSLNLNANISVPTGKTFSVVDGAVNLGTGALTIGGNPTVSTTKYFTYSNDGASASGLKGSTIVSGASLLGSGSAGWIKVTIGSNTGFIPVLSGSKVKH